MESRQTRMQLPQTMKTTITIPRSWTNLQFIHATVLTLWSTHTTPYVNLPPQCPKDLELIARDPIVRMPGLQPLTYRLIVGSGVVSFARAQLKKLQRTHWQTHLHQQQGVRLQASPRLRLHPRRNKKMCNLVWSVFCVTGDTGY